MTRFIMRRVAISIPVLLGISLATYVFLILAPGDPLTAMLNPRQIASLGPNWVEERREAMGLNEPLPVRYGLWLKEVAQGNLGYSYRGGQPVTELIVERIGPTLRLMATVLVFAIALAIPLGVLSALKHTRGSTTS